MTAFERPHPRPTPGTAGSPEGAVVGARRERRTCETNVEDLAASDGAAHESSRRWIVAVASGEQAASSGDVYVVDVVVREQHGVVHMLLELTDPSLAACFGRADVADFATGVLDGRVTGGSAI